MSEQKKESLGYDKELFGMRVEEAMHLAKMDFETLAQKFGELGYPISGSNLRTYVTQRNLSLKVLVYLSKALNVSMDYLIGNEVERYTCLNENFDHDIWGTRYSQYPGEYVVYFYPTRTNEPEEMIEASLSISKENGLLSTLKIPVPDGEPKIYIGHLVLSRRTDTAFLSMTGLHGEVIQITFNDPNTNQNKLRFCVAALLSISSGDAKRMPTMCRVIITECAVTGEGRNIIAANLRLNSKYIEIENDELRKTLKEFMRQEGIGDSESICQRLEYAFKTKTFLSIEEQYLLNTFKNDNKLTNIQTERLIAMLRNHSMSNINVKIPRSIDARLYLMMKEEGMFVAQSEDE